MSDQDVTKPDGPPPLDDAPTKPRRNRKDRPPSSSSSGGGRRAVPAAQLDAAVGNLDGLYALVGSGLYLFGAQRAAGAMAAARAELATTNREFLARDPELVKMLNKGAAMTGRVGFVVSNLTALAPVFVLAFAELRPAPATAPEG